MHSCHLRTVSVTTPKYILYFPFSILLSCNVYSVFCPIQHNIDFKLYFGLISQPKLIWDYSVCWDVVLLRFACPEFESRLADISHPIPISLSLSHFTSCPPTVLSKWRHKTPPKKQKKQQQQNNPLPRMCDHSRHARHGLTEVMCSCEGSV